MIYWNAIPAFKTSPHRSLRRYLLSINSDCHWAHCFRLIAGWYPSLILLEMRNQVDLSKSKEQWSINILMVDRAADRLGIFYEAREPRFSSALGHHVQVYLLQMNVFCFAISIACRWCMVYCALVFNLAYIVVCWTKVKREDGHSGMYCVFNSLTRQGLMQRSSSLAHRPWQITITDRLLATVTSLTAKLTSLTAKYGIQMW